MILGANVYCCHYKDKTALLAISPTFDGKRTIPSVLVTELMLDALNLTPDDKLLEIGTGSGSQTAMFAKTGAEVHSIELEPWLTEVSDLGCTNVYLHIGDGSKGLLQEGSFSAIVATCGVDQVPEAWKSQLCELGRLIAPVGDVASQRLTLFVKDRGELRPERIVAYVRFQMLREPPKPGKPKYFQD